MNLEQYLHQQEDCVLWALLADVATINAEKNKATDFWILVAKKLNDEINQRLFDANEDDLDDEED